MTAPSRLAAVAFGLESAYGTPAAPTGVMPWTQLAPTDNNPLAHDAAWRGSAAAVFGHETGPLDSSVSLSGPVLADSIGYVLAGILGDITFTGGTPNTHAMAVNNGGDQQPPSYTVSLLDPTGPVQFAGCRVASLVLDYGPGLLTHSTLLQGLAGAVPGSLSMPAAPTEQPTAGWRTALQVGGIADPRLLQAAVTLARPVTAKRNVDGSQAPWNQRAAELAVTGTLSFAVAADTYRQAYLAASTTSIDLAWSRGAGATLRSLQVHCSSVAWTQAARSFGSKWVQLDAAFEANAATADAGASGGASPVAVTLRNQIGSGVYR